MRLNHLIFRAILFSAGLLVSASSEIKAQGSFVRGDANCDGFVDASDATYIIDYLFNLGPAPPCLDAADVNDNGVVNTADIAYLASFLGAGGPPPPPPFPNCGLDPTADALICTVSCCPANHFKGYSLKPQFFTFNVFTEDQFMQDNLFLTGPILLANPVQKDSFNITDTTHHLHWYFAEGRDTLISLSYTNQFESTGVFIDSVRFFLVPTQKQPHAPPESLDHYKCYRISQADWLQKKPFMQDQFTDERADSLRRDLFCTPCRKNAEPMFDTITHYVAYLIAPGQPFSPFLIRQAQDQFSLPGVWVDTVFGSKYLLVPTKKYLPPPPPPDTGKNHYKTWRLQPVPFTATPQVKDQFMTDTLDIVQLDFLSNPVRKIVFGPIVNDTFDIVDPDDHLTWYRAFGRDTLLKVEYVNQFESTTVVIDSVNYLLVPAQKDGHPPFDSLDHYKAYRIRNPQLLSRPVQLNDQFDLSPENITSFVPVFFLTPCQKNSEATFDMITHYVAYSIAPIMGYSGLPRTITDQFFPTPGRTVDVLHSELLLVPTTKKSFGPPECSDGLDNDGDGLVDFPADCGCTDPSDNSEAPNTATECNDGIDNDGDGLVDLADCGWNDVCDNSEAPNPATQCNDGVDNDGDGLGDLADCGCTDVCDNSEAPNPTTQCNDGIDNDGDGFIDLADLGCSNVCDTSEFPPCDAIPGDANASGTITLGDVISIVNYIFNKPGCAPQPLCWLSGKLCRGDVNGSCTVTLADVIWLGHFIFAKPCAGPGIPPCCWKPIPCPGSTCCLPNPFCP